MSTCSFCALANREQLPMWILPHGDDVVSFKPFGATTKLHRMFVPKRHVVDAAEDPVLTGRCFEEAARWAAGKDLPFNLVVNCGSEAGQSVFHLHVHYVPREEGDGLGYRWKAVER